jgi:hypothetical protein
MKKINRKNFMIEKCKDIDKLNIPANGMTIKKINKFYSNISNKKLNKVFKEYYG